MSEHTPGPWHWEANPNARIIELISPSGCVMDFVRWGPQGAQPRFRNSNRNMEKVGEFFQTEPGREHHAHWHQLVEHPDAQLIADAWQIPRLQHDRDALLEAAVEVLDYVTYSEHQLGAQSALAMLRAAVEQAKRGKS